VLLNVICLMDVTLHRTQQEWDAFGSPHLGVAKISGEEVATGVPIERRWLRLKHRTGRPSNFGKARLLVSVDFDPVGPVRLPIMSAEHHEVPLDVDAAAIRRLSPLSVLSLHSTPSRGQ
jgi:hypothetical protein